MFTCKKLSVLLASALLLMFVLAACGGDTAVPDSPADTPADAPADAPADMPDDAPTDAPAERKVATFIWTQEFDNLNPLYTNMWFSSITQQIWNASAWNFDVDNNPNPVLVTEIPSPDNGGISADGRSITLQLRDDIVWSDGTPLTAADFLFTYEMVMSPNNIVNSTYPYNLIESIEAPDDRTVVTTFEEPFIPWVASLWSFVLPEHVLSPVYEAEGSIDTADWNLAPTVGAGPFVFVEWESGSFARFVRNDNYYNAPANIDEIFIRFVPDDAAQVASLRTGDGDLGTFIALSDVPTLEADGVEIVTVVSGYDEGWYLYFGEEAHPALSDVRVRQAIAMCFDRFAFNRDLLLDLTEPAVDFWDNTPYANPNLEAWPYDPGAANDLLDEAGWVDSTGSGIRDQDGVELVLHHGTTTREIRQDTQAVAQQQLAECGIGLETTGYAADVFFQSYGNGGPMATGELDIGQWSASEAFPDPDSSRWLCAEIPTDDNPDGSNDQKICDEELDELFRLQATQIDFEERQQTFWRISEIMHENVYWLGIWQDLDVWAVSARLTDVSISGASPFYNVAEWDIR
ncbi:MAG: peptide ABC transporter substrate-binding protein [Chloroflexota bacterium]|jgi:peptide/nickel transport system substrate-binding protein